jgi:hypothetical protein
LPEVSTSPIDAPIATPTPSSTSAVSYYGSPGSELSLISSTSPGIDLLVEDHDTFSFEITTLDLPVQDYWPAFTFSPTIPPYLHYDDVWRDVRTLLPPSLREVLCHYEYTTSLTHAIDDPAKAAWQSCVPELARNHQYLVDCVLSVASLHLGRLRENSEERAKMNNIAAARMNKAIASYRLELENVTQENAAALFASVTLTAVYLFRTSAIDIENLRASITPGTVIPRQDVIDKMLSYAIRTIHGLRGPLTVLMSGWNYVVGGKMQHVAARKWWPTDCMPATSRAVEEDRRLQRLEELWTGSEEGPRSVELSQALSILREVYALISHLTLPWTYPPMTAVPYSVDDSTVGTLTDRGAIFVWAARISREYLQLVEARDPSALIILAHYAVLPGRVRNVWWLEGLGADVVTAIAMALGRESWSLLEWPASVVGVDLENAFGARTDRLAGQLEEMGMEVI